MPRIRVVLMAAALALFAGTGFAAAPALAQAAKPAMTAAEKQARSKECSAQADQRGLKGKARKKFRSKCKRGNS